MTRRPKNGRLTEREAEVLRALLLGPAHGYGLSRRLRPELGPREVSRSGVSVILRRLESMGLARSQYRIVGGRARRWFSITASGRRALGAR